MFLNILFSWCVQLEWNSFLQCSLCLWKRVCHFSCWVSECYIPPTRSWVKVSFSRPEQREWFRIDWRSISWTSFTVHKIMNSSVSVWIYLAKTLYRAAIFKKNLSIPTTCLQFTLQMRLPLLYFGLYWLYWLVLLVVKHTENNLSGWWWSLAEENEVSTGWWM